MQKAAAPPALEEAEETAALLQMVSKDFSAPLPLHCDIQAPCQRGILRKALERLISARKIHAVMRAV
jgi:hypothetical protein